MKTLSKKKFTLIEIICAIVILALAFGGLLMSLHNSIFKVAVSNKAIQATLLAEKKLNSYKLMTWSDIPRSDAGELDSTESSGLRYSMESKIDTNDMGGFIHIHMTVYFPSVDTEEDHSFQIMTDIPLAPGEVDPSDLALREMEGRVE